MIQITFKYLLLILLAACIGNVSMAMAQPVNVAEIVHVYGDVKVKGGTIDKWVDAEVGMKLKEGDTVKTGIESLAELAFGEELKNIVKIFSNSQLTLNKHRPGLVNLTDGRVFSLIEKLDKSSTFEVRTPTAIAGARGTGWETAVEPRRDRTLVKGYSRMIYIAGLDKGGNLIGKRNLSEGFKSIIERDKGPGLAERLTMQEKRQWQRWEVAARDRVREFKKREILKPERKEAEPTGEKETSDESRKKVSKEPTSAQEPLDRAGLKERLTKEDNGEAGISRSQRAEVKARQLERPAEKIDRSIRNIDRTEKKVDRSTRKIESAIRKVDRMERRADTVNRIERKLSHTETKRQDRRTEEKTVITCR